MKVYSIVFDTELYPHKLALFSDVCITGDEALQRAKEAIYKTSGDLAWKPRATTIVEIVEPVEKPKNYLLECIINNKDAKLFKSSKKYLTVSEIKLVEEKLNATI